MTKRPSRPKRNPRDLVHIGIEGGVNKEGKPFCHVLINGGELKGQLDPYEVRMMALGWLEAAESAVSDALLVNFIQKELEQPFETVVQILAMYREKREEFEREMRGDVSRETGF